MILSSQIDNVYEEIFKELDISENLYEKANTSYQSFSNWLYREDSLVKEYTPEIYIQGSFKIGTVIKPIGENDRYDIDLVCKFNNLSKRDISQRELKDLLGKEVIAYANSKNMIYEPKNGKRCWTLIYRDESKFHMDILPCIDDSQKFIRRLESFNFSDTTHYKEKAIAITDTRSRCYNIISDDWEISNPKGYYLWFKDQSNFESKRILLSEKLNIKPEDLKEYKVKTPLQKTIQILKRHRDVMFENNSDNKPSSIIISTLAAKAYLGGENINVVLKQILMDMETYIERRGDTYYILNPVNPLENFADKWIDNPNLKIYFDRWITQAKDTLLFGDNSIEIYSDEFENNIFENLQVSRPRIRNLDKEKDVFNFINKIPHRQEPIWDMDPSIAVKILATKTKKGFSYPRQFKSTTLLTKDENLKFEAKAKNINYYDVFWQITNTGTEAKNNGCLRGDFYNGQIVEGKKIRKETTSFVGTHIVECYLVKNNICYGKSEPFIVNIKS